MRNTNKLRMTIVCGIFAAITSILAQIEIPLPLVPISGQTLAVGLTATILGSRYGAITMICYAALGAIGLPVFAQAKGGLGVLFGPTGGYIFAFIVAAYITGLILEKTSFSFTNALIANTVAMVLILCLGTIQLKFVAELSWSDAFVFGVYPFIIVGLIKAFLASWLGITVRKRLVQARLLQSNRPSARV
ncbi:biotin transporter BioY [Bacillus sp. NTK071]|uniref:Biotin transporter n=1 Tax=Guptibacillus hwajinpoensis TaxID=208199 RepID=A0A4U1M9M4_9BACL|nr:MULTISPECIES: biotin transporter BioY [Bacillaceae]MBN8210869.1 biotin transporter BioY [Bacillus sp. NTK071]TKD67487.1 biotin transporter BioY [Pseudalkalibacillus hwajinpoensis]